MARRQAHAIPREGSLLGGLFESLVTLSVQVYSQDPAVPTAAAVLWALHQVTRHFPSIFAPPLSDRRMCVAAEYDEVWPCTTYRKAEAILRGARVLRSPPRRNDG